MVNNFTFIATLFEPKSMQLIWHQAPNLRSVPSEDLVSQRKLQDPQIEIWNTGKNWSFYQISACKAPLHKREAPLLKIFWRGLYLRWLHKKLIVGSSDINVLLKQSPADFSRGLLQKSWRIWNKMVLFQ